MLRCGLLGRTLGHSYSPEIHRELGKYEYRLYEKEPEELEAFLTGRDWDCLNVTIPYKKTVMPFCAELSPEAREAGSVNTLTHLPDGRLRGDNTDVSGFRAILKKAGLAARAAGSGPEAGGDSRTGSSDACPGGLFPGGGKALVLGSGGASGAVCCALRAAGFSPVIISRTGENNYGNLRLHRDVSVIVNTTPVGMYPGNGEAPLSLRGFPNLRGVLDIIYNPARTALLLEAESLGIPCAGGLYMLVAQAKRASERFTGREIPDTETDRIFRLLSGKMQNIVLTGMPGCGKSTIAALLGERLGRPVLDTDRKIVENTGMEIPEIFARYGEAFFRREETEAIRELSKASGAVLSTGGGCVKTPENYALLHQNSRIVWIRRDLSLLAREGRPLSAGTDLAEMYREREPLYARFADATVPNDGAPEETAEAVVRALFHAPPDGSG